MVPCESLGTVSYMHFAASMAVSLAVSTQYTNVTDTNHSVAMHTIAWRKGRSMSTNDS